MVPKLFLTMILWASCMSCGGSEDLSLEVQCRSYRYPISIECTWVYFPVPKAKMPTEFITTYRIGKENSKPCLQPTLPTPKCTILDFLMFSTVTHVFNVTAIHPGGITTALFPFVPEKIMQPKPPEIARVSLIRGKLLRVEWDPPYTWPLPDMFELKYQVRYSRCKSKRFRKVGPTKHTSLTVMALHTNGKYCIQVNAQHYLGYGFPSEWSPTTIVPITLQK